MHAWHAVLAGSMMNFIYVLGIQVEALSGGDGLSGWAAQDRGLDLSKPCIRVGLSAALTLAPEGLAAEHAARVRQLVGQDGYATRQAFYGPRKLPQTAHRQTRQNSPLPAPPDGRSPSSQ
jgi:hypothetical protein